jgi:hypothetical protein
LLGDQGIISFNLTSLVAADILVLRLRLLRYNFKLWEILTFRFRSRRRSAATDKGGNSMALALDGPTLQAWTDAINATALPQAGSNSTNWTNISTGHAGDPVADILWGTWLAYIGQTVPPANLLQVYLELTYYVAAKAAPATNPPLTQHAAVLTKATVTQFGGQQDVICVSTWHSTDGACT